MGDHYQEVEETSWGQGVGSSCMGVFLGIILFFASFFLLFWNEARVDLSHLAQKSLELSATAENQAAHGKLVSVSGMITSKQLLGDSLFLQPGRYIFIDRTVEMFAWEQETEKRKKSNTTTYTYHRRWTNIPKSSSKFKYPQGRENPVKSLSDWFNKVAEAQIGIYHVNMNNLTKVVNHKSSCVGNAVSQKIVNSGGVSFPPNSQLKLSQENIKLTDGTILTEDYIFKGSGTSQNPQIGDLRICYQVLPVNTTVTLFGQLANSNRIVPYSDRRTTFYRLIPQPRQEAIAWLAHEHKMMTWVFRVIGFLMMWFGLLLAGSPISTILDIIPFVGDLVEGITGAVSFLAALILSATTILIATLVYNPVVLIVVIGIMLGTMFFLRSLKRQWQH